MNVSPNALQEPLIVLWSRLNSLNGLLKILANQLDNLRKLYTGTLKKHGKDTSHLAAGSTLVVIDLTGPTNDGWPPKFPSGGFGVRGEEYFEISNTIVRRESAWAVAQGYEAFESFLKDIAATCFDMRPERANADEIKKFEKTNSAQLFMCQDLQYWQTFVRSQYGGGRNNSRILKLLRKLAPGLDEAEIENNRAIDLRKWYSEVWVVRGAVTHSNMRIRKSQTQCLNDDSETFFPCEVQDGVRILNLQTKNATNCLEVFTQYAFQVFKFLSMHEGYEWNILGKPLKMPKPTM